MSALPRRDPGAPGAPDAPAAAPRRADLAAVAGRASSELDRLVHERLRLGLLSALAAGGPRTFTELRDLLEATDGNLSVHARKLEDAGYVSCTKGFDGRTPRTEYAITDAGRAALTRYLEHMEALIRTARGG